MVWDSTAALSLVALAGVLVLVGLSVRATDRSFVLAWLPVIFVDAALAGAGSPLWLLAFWQMHWFMVWAVAQFVLTDEQRAATGRWLIAGLLLDGLLIVAGWSEFSAATWSALGVDQSAAGLFMAQCLPWALAIAVVSRPALVPLGLQRQEMNGPLRTITAFSAVAALPALTPLLLRLIDRLADESSSRLALSQFFVFIAAAAAVCSVRSTIQSRRTAWLAVTFVAAASLFSVSTPPAIGRSIWLISVFAMTAVALRHVPEIPPVHATAHPLAGHPLFAQLLSGQPSGAGIWQLALAWPLRGAAHVTRFVDSLLFEQLPRRAVDRVREGLEPVTRVLPETSLPVALGSAAVIAWVVLAILALR